MLEEGNSIWEQEQPDITIHISLVAYLVIHDDVPFHFGVDYMIELIDNTVLLFIIKHYLIVSYNVLNEFLLWTRVLSNLSLAFNSTDLL